MRSGKIDTVYDFTDKGLHELESWLEPWFRQKKVSVTPEGLPGVPIDSAYKIPGSGLVYWYRLGEPGPWPVDAEVTADFMLDSSGNDHHLQATNSVDGGVGVYITNPASTELPLCDVTGALAGGNANDGGIEFRSTAGGISHPNLCLGGPVGGIEITMRGGSVAVGTASTFSAWVAYTSTFTEPLISTWQRTFGVSNYGAYLGFDGSGHMTYRVGAENLVTGFTWISEFVCVPNQWHHFATSIEKVGTDLFRRRLWVDSNKLIEVTDTQVVTGSQSATGANLTIGGGNTDDIRFYQTPGKVDEVAYWTSALTDAQVIDLWNARVLNEGETWGGEQHYVLPSPLPELPATPTAQDVADALVYLGLATQL